MPEARASGNDATANGNAKNRDHNQGNQDKKYTVEQKSAVIRVRKCSATSFYEILGCEKTASDGEIKKAYRKLSLLTHPDKNGYEGADEAFKSKLHYYHGDMSTRLTKLSFASGFTSFPNPVRCREEREVRPVWR